MQTLFVEELKARLTVPKLEDSPVATFRDCLCNIILLTATIRTWKPAPLSATRYTLPWWPYWLRPVLFRALQYHAVNKISACSLGCI